MPVALHLALSLLCVQQGVAGSQDWLVWQDSSRVATYQDAYKAATQSPDWRPTDQLNFRASKGAVWLIKEVQLEGELYLYINNPVLSEVDLYLTRQDSLVYTEQIMYLHDRQTGAVKYNLPYFQLPPNFTGRIMIRVGGEENLNIPLILSPKSQLSSLVLEHQTIGFIACGAILALVMLYMVIFLALKEHIYFTYLIYAFSIAIVIARNHGILYYWGTPYDFIQEHSILFNAVPSILLGIFSISFLKLKTYAPTIEKVFKLMVLLQILSILLSLAGYNSFAIIFSNVVALAFMPLALGVSGWLWKSGRFRGAKYFLISWLFLITGAIIYLLHGYGVISQTGFLAHHALSLGVVLEMVLLAVGLARQIDYIKKENIALQEENVSILEKQKEHLEMEVTRRTNELEAQNEEIRQQQQQIELINASLERTISQRTAQLKLQNDKLVEYAYFNAHRVRGPVARILGLVSLVKYYEARPDEIFEQINHCAHELDEVIKEVNSTLTQEE